MSSGRHGSWALRRFTWQARSSTSTSRTDYESLTLAFCLATRRCINLGPWLQAFVVEQFQIALSSCRSEWDRRLKP
jgi:hypothetical protein